MIKSHTPRLFIKLFINYWPSQSTDTGPDTLSFTLSISMMMCFVFTPQGIYINQFIIIAVFILQYNNFFSFFFFTSYCAAMKDSDVYFSNVTSKKLPRLTWMSASKIQKQSKK